MKCHRINILLPAYLDNEVTAEERKTIEEHLNSCPGCQKALNDLTKTVELTRNLPKLEPPPFFEQRIMARIREESTPKRSFWKKIFYPLHIKVPIQVMATVVIAVLAFYLYSNGDPELKRLAPLPGELSELKTNQHGEGAQKAGSPAPAAAPAHPRTKEQIKPETQPQYATPPQKAETPAKTVDRQASPQAEMSSAMKSHLSPAVKEKVLGLRPPENSRPTGSETVQNESPSALQTFPDKEEKKDKIFVAGVRPEHGRAMKAAPSEAKAPGHAQKPAAAFDVTIHAGDIESAAQKITYNVDQIGGRLIETQYQDGEKILSVEVDAGHLTSLQRRLEGIGRVEWHQKNPLLAGKSTVIIRIVAP